MCSSNTIVQYGSKPVNFNWSVVRGDTATMSVQFLESDETTGFDCSGWIYQASAYDSQDNILDSLLVSSEGSVLTITAPPAMTTNWGTRYLPVVAELPFDVQVRIPTQGEDIIWTPIIGTICVLGDVTPGGSL